MSDLLNYSNNSLRTRNTNFLEWLPVGIGLSALYTPSFYNLAYGHWQDDEYAHGPIILAAILWLFWDKRNAFLPASTESAPIAGCAFLLCGLLLYILGRSQGIWVLDIGSLVPVSAGILLAMRGWSAIRSLWFALFFIIFLVPLPSVLVDAITGPLKQQVSSIAEQILYTAGYPIARSGVVLTIGQYQLLVADACSGLNSMFSLSAIGLLYLYLVQRKSVLHNCLIVAFLLPMAFGANIIRVIFLILVTYYYGDAAGQGFLHGFSGMTLFVFSLVFVLIFDTILAHLIKPKLNLNA